LCLELGHHALRLRLAARIEIEGHQLAKALHGERFDLVLGPVGFDAKGDITAQGYVLYVWRDGNFTPAKSN
jgi:ABC-type branched-subunit amino acid transport system substrate-binding protein